MAIEAAAATAAAGHELGHTHTGIRQGEALRDLFQCCTWLTSWPKPGQARTPTATTTTAN